MAPKATWRQCDMFLFFCSLAFIITTSEVLEQVSSMGFLAEKKDRSFFFRRKVDIKMHTRFGYVRFEDETGFLCRVCWK
jgi:hypothetical protein